MKIQLQKLSDSEKYKHYLIYLLFRLDEDVVLDVTYNNYFSKLCDQCDFNVACLVTVKETDFEYFAQDDFRVRKPDIKFEVLIYFRHYLILRS